MRKALLTGFVLLCFALYSFHQRGGSDDGRVAVGPATPVTSQTPATGSNNGNAGGNTGGGSSNSSASAYKDGQYTGTTADAFYGYVQVLAVISGGKLTDVRFLQYPNDRSTSIEINSQAMPYLKQEALQAQSANVSGVSGATDTSQAFRQSLADALRQAGG